MNATIAKLVIGITLIAAWVGLAIAGKTDVAPLVLFIQSALAGLAAHALTVFNPAGNGEKNSPLGGIVPKPAPWPAPPTASIMPTKAEAAPNTEQSGCAMPAFLAFLATLALVAGCATTQSAQMSYVQACSAYGAAFETALQLRIAGRLNQSQIDQITLIDSQITPICTGAPPADPTAAVKQVTSAVTTLWVRASARQ